MNETLLRFDRFQLDIATASSAVGIAREAAASAGEGADSARTNAGPLVTREDIQREVWRTDTFVDFEQGLNYCLKEIRAALGDDARAPKFIETLPKRGYRFLASIETEPVFDSVRGDARFPALLRRVGRRQ